VSAHVDAEIVGNDFGNTRSSGTGAQSNALRAATMDGEGWAGKRSWKRSADGTQLR
jgi:hypothetical protein